jgi:aryl-alcohol dehydrogenase-like predicted oxidoreductase
VKIALGTVQFGLDYGAFNRAGQVEIDHVGQILELASRSGVTLLDTAHAYGNSETVLGALTATEKFGIVTKVPALSGADPADEVRKSFEQSLERLKTSKVHGLLLHRAEDLTGTHASSIWRELEQIRESGQATRVGFSVYTPEEAKYLLARYPAQIIQLPLNVFDRRHLDTGILDLCRDKGVEVHVRSAFLQGFALAQPHELRGRLSRFAGLLGRFRARCDELKVTPLQGALGYVLGLAQVDQAVVGVDSCVQFAEIISAAGEIAIPTDAFADIGCEELELIEPRRWN